MTADESLVLTSMLNLSSKVFANDLTVESDVAAINTVTETESSYINLVVDSINSMISASTKANEAVIAKIINSITVLALTKDVMIGLLTARNVDMNNRQAVANFIDSALSSTINDFRYYTSVVRFAIFLGDTKRIASAITKIQSLVEV